MSTVEIARGMVGSYLLSATRPGGTLTNSTTADQDFASIYTIPANLLTTNTILRVTLNMGLATGVSAATITQYLKLGATKICNHVSPSNLTDSLTKYASFHFYVVGTAAAGASVAVECATMWGGFSAPQVGFGALNNVAQPVAAIATNGALTIVPGAAWSATGSADVLTLLSAIVEQLN